MHPKRTSIHLPTHIGDRVADGVTNFFGTWLCLGLHTVWYTLWFVLALDVSLLTNIVSLEAIGIAILILMSNARSDARDRQRDDLESVEVENTMELVKQIHQLAGDIHKINLQQNTILDALKEQTHDSTRRRRSTRTATIPADRTQH